MKKALKRLKILNTIQFRYDLSFPLKNKPLIYWYLIAIRWPGWQPVSAAVSAVSAPEPLSVIESWLSNPGYQIDHYGYQNDYRNYDLNTELVVQYPIRVFDDLSHSVVLSTGWSITFSCHINRCNKRQNYGYDRLMIGAIKRTWNHMWIKN